MATNPNQSRTTRFGMRFFAVLLIGVAPVAGYHAVKRFAHSRQSVSWPTVPGRVVESGVEEQYSPGAKRSFSARVVYNYSAGGRPQTSSAVSLHDFGYGDRGAAEAIAARYPVDAQVTVYHDPADPSVAVLEPGASWRSYFLLGVPLLLAGVGLLLWLASARQDPPAQPPQAARA